MIEAKLTCPEIRKSILLGFTNIRLTFHRHDSEEDTCVLKSATDLKPRVIRVDADDYERAMKWLNVK